MPNRRTLPTIADCTGCGVCCLHMGYPSYVLATDQHPAEEPWETLPDDLKRELLAYIAHYDQPSNGELDGPCCWFDQQTRRCKHHEHRPRVCRDFEVGCQDCVAWREHYQIRLPTSD